MRDLNESSWEIAARVSKKLTQRQREVLHELSSDCLRGTWTTPMGIGGTDGSHHSAVLAQLHRKGLVARQLYGGHTRAAWRYRITAEGRKAIEAAIEDGWKRWA